MVKGKQMIKKIFHTDEEIAEEMLNEPGRNIDWFAIWHRFGVHKYSTLIKEKENKKVLKCFYCGGLKKVRKEIGPLHISSIFLGIAGGVLGTVKGLWSLTTSPLPNLLLIVLSLTLFYLCVKYGIERLFFE